MIEAIARSTGGGLDAGSAILAVIVIVFLALWPFLSGVSDDPSPKDEPEDRKETP